ncbi:MAG: hypothetical protein ACJ789_01415 [Thermomicrobiales bacterium]
MDELAAEAWGLYRQAESNDCVVKPSIPILYFGDRERYLRSPLKIATVALNPSRKEFPDEARFGRFPSASSVYPEIMEGLRHDEYFAALNSYFRIWPYRSWFSWFEEVLKGIRASYYDSEVNCALHTDLFSPLATDPTWSKLGSVRAIFETDGISLWHKLIEHLAPDIILISVARGHLDKIAFIDHLAWQKLHTVERDVPSKRPFVVDGQRVVLSNGKPALLVFGRAGQSPFATLTKGQRQEIGQAILESHRG